MKRRYFSFSFSVLILNLFIFAGPSHAAVIKIKAAFEGQAPAVEKIKPDADPKCKLAHPDGITSEEVLVNSNGTLKNVFVYVKEGLSGKTFETPKTPVTFDQQGCQYHPHVFGIQTGQTLEILNSDDTLHNVHALPANSQQFNLGMPLKGMKLKKTFAKPEIMVKIKCEVHPWMRAFAGVVGSPFFGVTGDGGTTDIKDLPAGEYTLEAWHEKYGAQTQKVTVTDKDQEVTFNFKT